MTDVKFEQRWSNKQLQKLLDTEHIRQHLIEVGLIDRFGEIVPKEEYERLHKRRSYRQRTSSKILDRRPLTSIDRHRSTSTSPSKQRNKSPTYLSSPHQSIRTKTISVQRTNPSVQIIENNNRCIITMIYYGPQTLMDYNRSWFESDSDDIVVMQQHCGGENIVVHKGRLKPNEIFRFQSRRHVDYPFALTFYVNGLIDNRLSICCESRYKHNVRIGGKRGQFGILNVEKSRACRRCRCEQRTKRMEEIKTKKLLPRIYDISTPEPNFTRSTSPESTPRAKDFTEQSIVNDERMGIHVLTGVDVRRENVTPSSTSVIEKPINNRPRTSISNNNGNVTRMRSFQLYRDSSTNTTDII